MLKRFLCFLLILSSLYTFTNAEEQNVKYNASELKEKFDSWEISKEEMQNIVTRSLGVEEVDPSDADGRLENIDWVQYYIDNTTWEKSPILTSEEANTKNNIKIIDKYEWLEVLIWTMKDEAIKEMIKKTNENNKNNHTKYVLWILFVLITLNSAWIVYLIFKRK